MHTDTFRILDANLNRAREALRVIEDHARFMRDDPDAAGAAKTCRHELRQIIAACGADDLLAARDIIGDVGRDTKTAAELSRTEADDVVRAAFGRLTEAARVLGEYAKLVSPPAAAAAEQLRYRAYELEQRVILRGTVRQRFRSIRLYVLLTAHLCRRPWLEVAEAAILGGAGCVQLREKNLDDAELLHRARQLRELTRAHHVLLAVNDRPDIARLAQADIIHVGQTDLSVRDIRRVAGGAVLVGKSTHTLDQFAAALAEEPDYLAVGPMIASTTKPQDHIAGPATLRAVRAQTDLSLVAIGGINPDNAAEIMAAGANSLAVCGVICGASDPQAATRTIAQSLPA